MAKTARGADWMVLASDALEVAKAAWDNHPRSAVSRAYYAAFAAAHAILLAEREKPRAEFGTWSHETVGQHLKAVLSRSMNDRDALFHRSVVEDCQRLRVSADYGPMHTIGKTESREAIRMAGQLVDLARRRVA